MAEADNSVVMRVFALLFALAALPAAAEECYAVDSARGSVSFNVSQAGASFRGTFRRFGGDVCLEQERIVRIDVWLEPASVATDLPEIDAALKDKEFFDTGKHPRMSFASSSIEAQGDRQLARGTLDIKGKRREVGVPIRLRSGDRPTVSGSFALNRLDYDVGIGEWADTRWLGAEVKVEFTAPLSPSRPPR